ncbi:MAG: CcmD family protein [Acidobacteriota bacterium]
MGLLDNGNLWLAAVNFVIWTGIFLYVLKIERKLDQQAALMSRSEETSHE